MEDSVDEINWVWNPRRIISACDVEKGFSIPRAFPPSRKSTVAIPTVENNAINATIESNPAIVVYVPISRVATRFGPRV